MDAAKDKLGEQLTVLDMRALTSFCDYFVIVTAGSMRQVNAISDSIQDELAKDRIKPLSQVRSNDQSGWIVLDFNSVVAHIFYEPMREFYALEHLWADAKKVRLSKKLVAKKL
ncbi:MAG: ribosome silencing factor [Candidatus Omnitrophica bacterium]|nr:ribosome silencing factor [Candidatus Omnitrophota bacterium]